MWDHAGQNTTNRCAQTDVPLIYSYCYLVQKSDDGHAN